MGLDFKRCTDLFLGTEQELALALRLPLGDLRSLRQNPRHAPAEVLSRLAVVLDERGRAMLRVAEMLREDALPERNGDSVAG